MAMVRNLLAVPFFGILLLLSVATPVRSAPQAQSPPPASPSRKVTLDFKDAQLEEVVKTISELTGKNFVYDKGLKGDITIVSPQSVTVEEAYELFLTILSVKGYTVIPSGK
ncbi:MAG: hypothetical protein JXB25_03840, partial [Deltaproteobacteria bacterium]|nr:hypothetical protein [Deltaproteobacteria bacterium]